MSTPTTERNYAPAVEEVTSPGYDRGWQTVVWDDPINLMSYVSFVFRSHFGISRDHAQHLMLAVHNDGHAVVAEGMRELMEHHAHAMHDYGLWATVRKAPE